MQTRAEKTKFSSQIVRQLSDLYVKDNFTNVFYLAIDWAIIITSCFEANFFNNWGSYFIAVFLIGSRMRALENLLHNGSHHMLFANKKINNIFTKLFCAYPIFLSFNLYKESHMDHHRWLGDKNRDPDYIRYQKLGIDQLPFSYNKMLLNLLKMFSLIGIPKYVFGSISSTFLHNNRNNEVVERLIFTVIVSLIVIYLFSAQIFIKFWLVPYVTAFQVIRYLAELSEHGGLYGHTNKEIYLARNNTAGFMSFFIYPHNDNYHLVHHLFPAIPHFNMKNAHKILMQDYEYQQSHICHGYFFNFSEGKTTFRDLII